MTEPVTINIGNVSDGALIEAFDLKLKEVLANIADANTPPTAKREICLRLILKPKEDRVQVSTRFHCTAKLAPIVEVESRIFVGKDKEGFSQVVTIKEGTVTRTAVEVPQEIPLIPWRTFRDANPVESKFMLRLKGVKDSVPMVALYEIDAKWQLDTINSVAAYLSVELPEATIIT